MYSNTHHTKTLADLLDGGRRLTDEEMLSIIFPAVSILADMHRHGKIHGHISPKHIILQDNDRLLFCCRLNAAAQTRLLKSIRVSGTAFGRMISLSDSSGDFEPEAAPYRALETYMNGPLTPAADIYSLCAVIYRAVTGTPPKTAQEKMYVSPLTPSASNAAGSDTGLTDILNKGMSLLPVGRYADAGELAAVLEIYSAKTQKNSDRTEVISQLITVLNRIPVRLVAVLEQTAAQTKHIMPSGTHSTLSADFLNILAEKLKKSDHNFSRNTVTSITFLSSADRMPLQWADVTAEGNGGIAAWAVKNKDNDYSVYVAAKGGVHTGADCCGMFADCPKLKYINFNGSFDTSAAISMQEMFYRLPKLSELSLKDFRTFNTVNMSQMFWGCESLPFLDLKSFDTSAVSDMSGMFYGCSSLTSLDLTSFDTSNTKFMRRMFQRCLSLEALNIHHFNTSGVENMECMFESCYSLKNHLKEIIASLDFSCIIGNGLKDIIKDTDLGRELTALSLSLASRPPVEKLLKPLERIRLLCEDFAAKYPKRYSTGISSVLKTGLGLTDEKVYLSHDDTWLKSGKNGFAVTDHSFVCRNFLSNPQALSFKDFKAVKEISPITSKLSDGNILADGQPIVYVSGASDTEKNDLNHLIQSIQKTL